MNNKSQDEKLFPVIDEVMKEQCRIRSLIKILLNIYEDGEISTADSAVIVRILKEKTENVIEILNPICQKLEIEEDTEQAQPDI